MINNNFSFHLVFISLCISFCLGCNNIPPIPSPFSNCEEEATGICRGPRCPVGDVDQQPAITYPATEVVNVKDFGAVGDGMTDDTQSVQTAAATRKILYFPTGRYVLDDSIMIYKGVYGEGKIISSSIICFKVKASHVFIRGITIESTVLSGVLAPFAVYALNQDHLEITYTTLVNNRIAHRSDDAAYHVGLKIEHNKTLTDFTSYFDDNIQNDIITIRGIDSVSIQANSITCKNPNRVFKIADNEGNPLPTSGPTAKVSPFNSKNIIIEDNVIIGETISGKQVADLFHGTQNFTFQYNYVDVKGFGSIIENKTTIATHFKQNTKINNNILKNDHSILHFQGSWGALTPGHESGYQNILVQYNEFIGKACFQENRGLVRIRYFHQVDVLDNELFFEEDNARISSTFLSNKATHFSGNLVHKGSLHFTLAINSHNGASFDARVDSIYIRSNYFKNGKTIAGHGIIHIDNIGSSQTHLEIGKNKFRQISPRTPFAIAIRKSQFAFVSVTNNKIHHSSNTINGLSPVNSTIDTLKEKGNSW